MKTLHVELSRLWDGHEAGEVVTVEDYTARSMVKKGYGKLVKRRAKTAVPPVERRPQVETAEARPTGETMEATPAVKGTTGGKGGD